MRFDKKAMTDFLDFHRVSTMLKSTMCEGDVERSKNFETQDILHFHQKVKNEAKGESRFRCDLYLIDLKVQFMKYPK